MKVAATALAVLALAACGGSSARSPEAVARAWSAAIDRSDDAAAAKLFAGGATIVQNGSFILSSRELAVRWNAALPCGGDITRVLQRQDHEVLVLFRLRERPGHTCDAPGAAAAAIFRVEHGKIVLWHQTTPPGGGDGQTI